MASVKWLRAIEAIERPFDGFQQAVGYHFRRAQGEKGEPCSLMRVNSLMAPPGIVDFYTRRRIVDAGSVQMSGRAWSGVAPVERVEFAVDGEWTDAVVAKPEAPHAWQSWQVLWHAKPGEHRSEERRVGKEGRCGWSGDR